MAGSIVLVSLVLGETLQCLFHSCTLGVRDYSRLVWITAEHQGNKDRMRDQSHHGNGHVLFMK